MRTNVMTVDRGWIEDVARLVVDAMQEIEGDIILEVGGSWPQEGSYICGDLCSVDVSKGFGNNLVLAFESEEHLVAFKIEVRRHLEKEFEMMGFSIISRRQSK